MMDCWQCKATNHDTAQFCASCGARLALVCPACGSAVSPEAHFCRNCGQRLTPVAPPNHPAPPAGALAHDAPVAASTASTEPQEGTAQFQEVRDFQELAALQDEIEDAVFTIAGRYTVLSTLGQGGMGTVFKARDPVQDRTVAIKTIHPKYLSNPQAYRRFVREAQALARLDHPNILTLFESGQDGLTRYLVMELGGRDLVRRLEDHRGQLPMPSALHIVVSTCQALEHAHRHGIVHRDLKPANILIGSPDDDTRAPIVATTAVKVMDFGLAKLEGASALTLPSQQLGTPQYMAPEQVLAEPIDARSDLYALGVVMYELLTGVRPFDGEDPKAILYQHLTMEPVAPSVFNDTIPPDLEQLVLGLLQKDRAQRPSSATEVRLALRAIGAAPA